MWILLPFLIRSREFLTMLHLIRTRTLIPWIGFSRDMLIHRTRLILFPIRLLLILPQLLFPLRHRPAGMMLLMAMSLDLFMYLLSFSVVLFQWICTRNLMVFIRIFL